MNDKLLEIYLNDHLAVLIGEIEVAQRSRKSNADNVVGVYLEQLIRDLEADEVVIKALLAEIGGRQDPVKKASAWLGEKLGRLKLNGRLVGYSPLSRVVELDGLVLGAQARVSLWQTLDRISASDDRFQEVDFPARAEQAARQRDQLNDLRLNAAIEAF